MELARKLDPGLVLMDAEMPELNGITAARRLRAECPRTRVLVLSACDRRAKVQGAIEAGASGYLLKTASAHELFRAIRTVARGGTYVAPGAAQLPAAPRGEAPAREAYGRLGTRELEVLQLLAEGHSSRTVAARLGLSPATVETHRRNIMRKLDLHSVAELTRYAVREGLVAE